MKLTLPVWLSLGVLLVWCFSVSAVENCTIPPGTSNDARADGAALKFSFTPIQNNIPFGLFPEVAIEEHLFTVTSCSIYLYVKSAVTPGHSLINSEKLAGQQITCTAIDEQPLVTSGMVLKFFSDTRPRPSVVPSPWYDGDRLVLRIAIHTFPTTRLVMRCGVKTEYSGFSVEVFSDITLDKIGCPSQKYGAYCKTDCNCIHGGYCHTFKGSCICPQNYAGPRCEIAPTTGINASESGLNVTTLSPTVPQSTRLKDDLPTDAPKPNTGNTDRPKLNTDNTIGDGSNTSTYNRADFKLILELLLCLVLTCLIGF